MKKVVDIARVMDGNVLEQVCMLGGSIGKDDLTEYVLNRAKDSMLPVVQYELL